MIDTEQILYGMDAALKTRLNAEIGLINTEKADAVVLLPVDNAAIFVQQLNDKTINYDPYIIHGISAEAITSAGRSSASRTSLFIVLAISSQNVDNIPKRLLRYSRAIKQVVLKEFDTFKPDLTGTGPITFQDSNTGNFHKGIGLEFEITAPF